MEWGPWGRDEGGGGGGENELESDASLSLTEPEDEFEAHKVGSSIWLGQISLEVILN